MHAFHREEHERVVTRDLPTKMRYAYQRRYMLTKCNTATGAEDKNTSIHFCLVDCVFELTKEMGLQRLILFYYVERN